VVAALEELAASDEIVAQNESQVASALAAAKAGADFSDALIIAAANEAGCARSVTLDAKASRKLGYQLLEP
jgi:predicted nucleic-acid-binding protein